MADNTAETQADQDNSGDELPKAYDAAATERRWYSVWEDAGVFKPTGEGEPYVIMMPPPNVTGTLHNGHALFVTLQDVLSRYHRMRGRDTLWLPGVDHAGIATQAVVERELKRHEGKSRHDLGRDAFLERVWDWKNKNGDRIVEQLKVMGASADWTRERFTMDEQCSTAVREAFVRMWNDGLIYRGERLVNWDPITRTALSDEEVEHEERDGELWEFAYKIKEPGRPMQAVTIDDPDGAGKRTIMLPGEGAPEVVVATTRPETMLGDTAVAVHPDDERYAGLVGKELFHPFFTDRTIKVIADEYVDREFGTGAVKITPAHDPNDFDMGQRHELELINILDEDGSVNENGGPFQGQDRYVARKNVKSALEGLGLFRGTQAMKHNVSISQRSGEAIEPMLSRQYFVNAKPLADKAIAAVDSGETRILPAGWRKTWDHFMHNIRDWCISRQLWWGHRIPVFYDLTKIDEAIETDANRKGGDTAATRAQADGKVGGDLVRVALQTLDDDLVRYFSTASTEDLVNKEPDRWLQEEDVLDTWFSSGLWPFSTLGWPNETEDLQRYYPGAVLETGFDILFFWVARMMMMGCHFMGKAPFSDVYLHAMVRDSHGRKMSKSLGNAIDPLDVIDGITVDDLVDKTKTYPVPEKMLPKVLKGIKKDYPEGIPSSGADGLRFTLAALAGPGRDVKLAIGRVSGYRNFLNKIWNATRFALMRVGHEPLKSIDEVKGDLSLPDRWILSRLEAATVKTRKSLDDYRFDEAANAIYQFFWTELCDWYIELAKGALYDDAGDKERQATRATLVHVLDASMRLLHPLCPFLSEEIWQRLPDNDGRWQQQGTKFCAVAPYPEEAGFADEAAESGIELLMNAVTMARNARQESGLGAQQKVKAIYLADDEADRKNLTDHEGDIVRLASLESMEVRARTGFTVPKHSAVNADSRLEVVVPLEGLIDLEAEQQRLQKEIEKVEKERKGLTSRLDNPSFADRAPAEVVDKARADLANVDEKLGRLKSALARVSD
jgi:valyl-tRNA synthetase